MEHNDLEYFYDLLQDALLEEIQLIFDFHGTLLGDSICIWASLIFTDIIILKICTRFNNGIHFVPVLQSLRDCSPTKAAPLGS